MNPFSGPFFPRTKGGAVKTMLGTGGEAFVSLSEKEALLPMNEESKNFAPAGGKGPYAVISSAWVEDAPLAK